MASPTITVRFEKELYDKIKNHSLSASEIIRNGVILYFNQLEEQEYKNTVVKQDILHEVGQVKKTVTHSDALDIKQNKSNNVEKDISDERINHEIDEILPLINELKNKISQLDKEIEYWSEKCEKAEKKEKTNNYF